MNKVVIRQLYFSMELSIKKIESLAKLVIKGWFSKIFIFLAILLFFFVSIELMIKSLAVLGKGTASELISAAEIPSIAIFIGLLTTAILQSSSSVTSIAVAMVASQAITLDTGIYIVMGANVGTTLTSNIVSLGFITNRSSFRKALSTATIHDFFNMLTVIIIFPLEYYYGVLSRLSKWVAGFFAADSINAGYPISDSGIFWLKGITNSIYNSIGISWLVLLLSVIVLVLSIKMFSTYSYKLMIGDSRDKLKSYIFDKSLKSFSWGLLFTGTLQSSSITTSLVVPLVATGKVTLHAVFPFILGANIGTTITALLAGFLKTEVAISLALGHLFFNLIGVLLFLPFPALRSIPEKLAGFLGRIASERRLIVFFYILFTFFIIPFILIYLSR
jgi:sodium-dependent phosphate cotransporter